MEGQLSKFNLGTNFIDTFTLEGSLVIYSPTKESEETANESPSPPSLPLPAPADRH